jgi:hypothetical protein
MPEYLPVALSKRAGEDALRGMNDQMKGLGIDFVVVSGDMIEGTVTATLLNRANPGVIEQRKEQVGKLYNVDEFAAEVAWRRWRTFRRTTPASWAIFPASRRPSGAPERLRLTSRILLMDPRVRACFSSRPHQIPRVLHAGLRPVAALIPEKRTPKRRYGSYMRKLVALLTARAILCGPTASRFTLTKRTTTGATPSTFWCQRSVSSRPTRSGLRKNTSMSQTGAGLVRMSWRRGVNPLNPQRCPTS